MEVSLMFYKGARVYATRMAVNNVFRPISASRR